MQDKSKPLSGWQRRQLRIARGLPPCTAQEAAANKARRARGNERRAAANFQLLTEVKLASGCVDCGYKEHPAALDFDHLPGQEKYRDISRMLNVARSTLLAEIAKCEVVCANCHRIRSWERTRSRNLAERMNRRSA